jgi:hypothetical protein
MFARTVMCGYSASVWRHAVDDGAADRNLALGDLLEPGDHPQQRRLAAARGPDEHAELTVGDRDVDTADHMRGSEVLVHLANGHCRHVPPSSSCDPPPAFSQGGYGRRVPATTT